MRPDKSRGLRYERPMLRSNLLAACLTCLTLSACGGPEAPPSSPEAPTPKPSRDAMLTPADKPHFGPALARRGDVVDTLHGVEIADPYRWLEDASSAETQAWMKGYADFTADYLKQLPGRAVLATRLKELSYIDFVGAPRRRGKRYFFSRRHKDKEKSVWYWRASKAAEPKVLLDPNSMSQDGSVALKEVTPSYDGKTIVFKLSKNNADQATLHIMDVATGQDRPAEAIEGAKYAYPSWSPDNLGFYYVKLPTDPKIPAAELPGYAELRYHRLGQDPAQDELIYEKTGDPKRFLHGDVSRDGRWLFVYQSRGWNSRDVYYRDLKGAQPAFRPLVVGVDAKFDVYAWKDKFYIQTEYKGAKGRMLVADAKQVTSRDKSSPDDWRELVAEQPDAVLQDFNIVGGRLALNYLRNASTELRIHELSGALVRKLELPGIGSSSNLSGNPEDDEAYYTFSSFTTPYTTFEVSVRSGKSKPYFELEVPVDPKPYEVQQVWFTSKDGTKVSMFVVLKKGAALDGSTPFLLRGYGGFNISETPDFDASDFAWLERGAGIAVPNLRGGGEYGEEWHRDGMLLKKQNVFDDFIAAAEYLIAKGYTKPTRLAIAGGSNGGLLVGAAMTQRPELFQAVACGVPLLDMLRYHLFGSGKTWIEEYGSADDAEQFKALRSYSPYQRVKPGTKYPALLMLSADSDDRVDPMHARKFTAAIQAAQADSSTPVLFRMETNAGHGGGDMVEKTVDRKADTYAFLFSQLGVELD